MFWKKIFLTILFVTPLLCVAQTVRVSAETIKIKDGTADGYSASLDGTFETVQSQLEKFLKQVGKARRGEDASSISLPTIEGKTYTSPLYFVTRDNGKGTAWVGILKSEWASNADSVLQAIERMVYDFSVKFYQNKIQLEIDESNQALQAVEKQRQRLVSQNNDLHAKLEDNKKEKNELDKALENNKLELEALNRKIEQNKKDQDSVAVAAEKITKVIELQKEKQRKVN